MSSRDIVSLVITFLSSSAAAAIFNILYDRRKRKRETKRQDTDGRLQDWKEKSEKDEKRMGDMEKEQQSLRQELASLGQALSSLGRDFAALEQYSFALEVIIRRLDPGAQIPPRPNRERRGN